LNRLLFFPAPYPDEILYSVLCRFHIRCGIPCAKQTNLAVWGKSYGNKLFLPDNIEEISLRIPQEANLTAERFISENTIFPLLKPFLTQEKGDAIIKAMMFGNAYIYNIIGFVRVFTMQHRYLRYCNQCVESDTKIYGEPYWHRIHQISGVYFCPIHGTATIEADVNYGDLTREFYPLIPSPNKDGQSFEPQIADKLLYISREVAWLLQHSARLGCYERTLELYLNWLRLKGYRDRNGITQSKKLAQNIVDFYGQRFLTLLNAYDSGACTWVKRITRQKQGFHHPLYHLLLICFLAGSAAEFFNGIDKSEPKYLPYGTPPYPCRNIVCDYHLQDVIDNIEIIKIKSMPKATFTCPHCGFSYRRKKSTPKEKQYSGQINIVDYGWKWEEAVTAMLGEGTSPYLIAHMLHCDVRTILTFGVERKMLPSDALMSRKPYTPIESPQKKPDFESRRVMYRQRWLNAITANPEITRKALRTLESKADQWLHMYDAEWLEQNSPSSRRSMSLWAGFDDKYLASVKVAVNQILDSPGMPIRISFSAVGRKAGIVKPCTRLKSDFLPLTKSFIAANVETLEQWQKRKIIWTVRQMRERGELLTVYKVRYAAAIQDKERKLDLFIKGCIENSEYYR